MMLIITEKPRVAKSIAPILGAKSGAMAVFRATA